MPTKKVRARAKEAAAAQTQQPIQAKALGDSVHDDLARKKKADLRAARRLARNYGNGSNTVSTLDDQRRRALMEAYARAAGSRDALIVSVSHQYLSFAGHQRPQRQTAEGSGVYRWRLRDYRLTWSLGD
jgi:hypothetical protein